MARHCVIRPQAQAQRYEWESIYGVVTVVTGPAQFQFLPSVSLELSRGCLQQIAAGDAQAQQVVLWDQAGFHPRAGDPQLTARIHWLPLLATKGRKAGKNLGQSA